MPHLDSLDKIVCSYFHAISKVDFTWRGRIYKAKPLVISPLLLRGFTCPEECGGCCPRFSLDYLPTEKTPKGVTPRKVIFNGRGIIVMSDLQKGQRGVCSKLNCINGRCTIHGVHPFSCDFELIRVCIYANPNAPNRLYQRLYGRGWNFKRCGGGKGALCKLTPANGDTIKEVRRKIQRLQEWAIHFGLVDNWCPLILDWIDNGNHARSYLLSNSQKEVL